MKLQLFLERNILYKSEEIHYSILDKNVSLNLFPGASYIITNNFLKFILVQCIMHSWLYVYVCSCECFWGLSQFGAFTITF